MSEPLVSTILPVFNCERFIGAALDSVLAQSHPRVEIIVVDDGSSDASAAVAEERGVRVLRREHAGVSAARNAGIAAAGGELVAFLDADDLWPADRLEHQVAYFRDRPDTQILMGYSRMFLEPGEQHPEWLTEQWIASLRTVPIDGVDPAPGMSGAVQSPLTMMVRAELFDAVGGFDTSYAIGEDIEWLMRATDAGYPHEVLDRVVTLYRLHATNTVYRTWEMERAHFRVVRSSIARKRALPAVKP
jgi:glycosyltransferase involved in cell wall biosynthesis